GSDFRQLTGAMGTALCLHRNACRARRTFLAVGFFVRRMLDLVDHSHQQKNCACNDEKINQQRNEVAIIPCDCSGFCCICRSMKCDGSVLSRPENHKFVGEIESASEQADWWHDDVFDQRINDTSKCRADDYTNGKIDGVAFYGEFFELLPD